MGGAYESLLWSQAARTKEFCTQHELRLLRQIIISMDLYLPRTTARYQAAERSQPYDSESSSSPRDSMSSRLAE